MMFVHVLPVLSLLSVRCASSDCVAPSLKTFRLTDPDSGKEVECDRCPPGQYLSSRCTEKQKSACSPCPPGSFTELWNHISKCLRCGVCGHNQVVKKECSADSDCQCECQQGYFNRYDMCIRHRECPSGEGVLTPGTANEDTVCQVCPNGTYSDIVSAQQICMHHRNCEAAGLQLVLKGSSWHDSVCTTCEELKTRDGAEYFREILPAFFVHQRNSRRLRQIVHKLLPENGKNHLDLSGLHAKLNKWVASATVKQLRGLPKVLTKTGANGAVDKLQNKLWRIDSHLKGLCVLEN